MKKMLAVVSPIMLAFIGANILLLYAADAQPAPRLKDLGMLTPNTTIPLTRGTERKDFLHFEITAASLRDLNAGKTNEIKFTTTNNFLYSSNFTSLPSGRTLLGLKSITADGSSSDVTLFEFNLRRSDKLPPPTAETVRLLVTGHENARSDLPLPSGEPGEGSSLLRAFHRITATQAPPPPPMPMVTSLTLTNTNDWVTLPSITNDWTDNGTIRPHPEIESPPPIPIENFDVSAEVEAYSGGASHMFYRVVPMEQLTNNAASNQLPSFRKDFTPLPGTNETYAEGMDRMAEEYAKKQRRNQ